MSRKKRGKEQFKLQLKRKTLSSILSVVFFASAALIIFSFLRKGLILKQINQYLTEWFGIVSIFFPFLLICIGAIFSKLNTPLKELNVSLGMVLFSLSILGIGRSGRIGSWIWDKVEFLITPVGAFLIFISGALIGLVVLFNTSIDQLITSFIEAFSVLKKYFIAAKKVDKTTLFIGDKNKKAGAEKIANSNYQPAKRVVETPAYNQPQKSDELIIANDISAETKVWKYPPLDLLSTSETGSADRGDVKGNAGVIERTLDSFGVTARVAEINMGPAVTQYALEVALGTKLSKITALANDLALSLAAPTGQIRIEAPIPGRSLVGIEVPNRSPQTVSLLKMLSADYMQKTESKLLVPLGLDVSGELRFADVKKMPHALIAGQTGSGKSVLLNAWISTILFRAKPTEVKLILIDPKRVEMTQYNGIPHLLTPVIHEHEKVLSSLKWAMDEMKRRYQLFAEMGARNIDSYNEMAGIQLLPYVLIIIDELAEIILFAPAEVEDYICRLAQMARATGVHLILATQRPSVDVLTGLIKANIPCRISFGVASMTDSRVILDMPGAEKLLGRGDMLYIPPDQAKPTRIQGPFVSDQEVHRLTEFLKGQGAVTYDEKVITQPIPISGGGKTFLVNGEEHDEFFDESMRLVIGAKKASASLLQRRLKIGYARAARILDQLEAAGVVGPTEGSKPREVLVDTLPESPENK